MIALLRKDVYLLGKQVWILLVIALVFSMTPQFASFGTTYLMVVTMTLPLTTLAYDERCRWDKYMAMTPCPPKKIVLSKYVFTLILIFGVLGLTVLIDTAKNQVLGVSYDLAEQMVTRLSVLALVLIVNAVTLPAVYRLGAEKGRLAMMLVCFAAFGVIVGSVFLVGGVDETFGWLEQVSPAVLGVCVGILAVVLNVLSFFLSVHFYLKRRAGEYN